MDQFSDPEGYMNSLGAVFEQYPTEVVVYVTDPRTGVQRNCKWPPTIAEIVEACDARVAEVERKKRYENWGKNDAPLLEAPRENRPTYEQLKEKYGDWTEEKKPKWYDAPPKPIPEEMFETGPDGKKSYNASDALKRAIRERDELKEFLTQQPAESEPDVL